MEKGSRVTNREIIINNNTIDVSFLNDTAEVGNALEMALRGHAGELRKIRGEPFITHPLAVVAITNAYDASDRTQIRGLLHDIFDSTVARTRITPGEIRENFGTDMVTEIGSLSKSHSITEDTAQREDYLLMTEAEDNPAVQVTRSGDKISNIISAIEELQYVDTHDDFWSEFKGGKKVYLQWPSDVLIAIKKSRAITGHPILDQYEKALSDLYRIAE